MALLGIDLGTSGVRACLAGLDGHVLGLSREEYPVATPRRGWAEQDPPARWNAACRAIRQALRSGGIPPKEVAAIGLSGQMHGLVLLDTSGMPVRPAIVSGGTNPPRTTGPPGRSFRKTTCASG